MIVRWCMALSEFIFNIAFISGEDNGAADSMPRLCRNNMIDNPREYSEEYIISASIIEKFKLTPNQQRVIASVHNSFLGHFGLERTLRRLKKIGETWEFQRQHVRHSIDRCPCCQKMSILKIPIHAHHFITSTYTPMACLNIDFFDPYPDGGHILVIVLTFTVWIELYHIFDASSFISCRMFVKIFWTFWCTLSVTS